MPYYKKKKFLLSPMDRVIFTLKILVSISNYVKQWDVMTNALLKNDLFDVVDFKDLIIKAKLGARIKKYKPKVLQLFSSSTQEIEEEANTT